MNFEHATPEPEHSDGDPGRPRPGGALEWYGAEAPAASPPSPDRLSIPPLSDDLPLGLAGDEVRVVAYQPDWPARFAAEEQDLRRVLHDIGFTVVIEHVGSTAVTGLAAKPIVDIALGVDHQADVGPLLQRLLESGRDYIKAGNQPGMLLVGRGDPRQFLYHLVVRGTPAWDRLLLVRQQLRQHAGLAKEYEELKRAAAAEHPRSRLRYAQSKSDFVRTVLNRGHLHRRRAATAHAVGRQWTVLDDAIALLQSGPAPRTPDAFARRPPW